MAEKRKIKPLKGKSKDDKVFETWLSPDETMSNMSDAWGYSLKIQPETGLLYSVKTLDMGALPGMTREKGFVFLTDRKNKKILESKFANHSVDIAGLTDDETTSVLGDPRYGWDADGELIAFLVQVGKDSYFNVLNEIKDSGGVRPNISFVEAKKVATQSRSRARGRKSKLPAWARARFATPQHDGGAIRSLKAAEKALENATGADERYMARARLEAVKDWYRAYSKRPGKKGAYEKPLFYRPRFGGEKYKVFRTSTPCPIIKQLAEQAGCEEVLGALKKIGIDPADYTIKKERRIVEVGPKDLDFKLRKPKKKKSKGAKARGRLARRTRAKETPKPKPAPKAKKLKPDMTPAKPARTLSGVQKAVINKAIRAFDQRFRGVKAKNMDGLVKELREPNFPHIFTSFNGRSYVFGVRVGDPNPYTVQMIENYNINNLYSGTNHRLAISKWTDAIYNGYEAWRGELYPPVPPEAPTTITKAKPKPTRKSPLKAVSKSSNTLGMTIIGCGKAKRGGNHAAKNLYTSSLFMRRRLYAELRPYPWAILSAKYGLVKPDEWVANYNASLDNLTPRQKGQWRDMVADQLWRILKKLGAKEDTLVKIELHMGPEYKAQFMKVLDLFENLRFEVDSPAKGGIPKQQKWLTTRIDEMEGKTKKKSKVSKKAKKAPKKKSAPKTKAAAPPVSSGDPMAAFAMMGKQLEDAALKRV